jgi:hypothetical protein
MTTPPVPDYYLQGFQLLLRLSGEQVEALDSALASTAPTLRSRDLASALSENVPGVDDDDMEEVVEAILSLYRFQETFDEDDRDFLGEFITDSILNTPDLDIPEEFDAEGFAKRLDSLLSHESTAGVTAKALLLLRDHEHRLCHSRLYTDVRHIFLGKAMTDPAGAVIVHQLKIAYHQGRELREFFVALDTADIAELRDMLDRADRKADSIKRSLERASVPYIDAE